MARCSGSGQIWSVIKTVGSRRISLSLEFMMCPVADKNTSPLPPQAAGQESLIRGQLHSHRR